MDARAWPGWRLVLSQLSWAPCEKAQPSPLCFPVHALHCKPTDEYSRILLPPRGPQEGFAGPMAEKGRAGWCQRAVCPKLAGERIVRWVQWSCMRAPSSCCSRGLESCARKFQKQMVTAPRLEGVSGCGCVLDSLVWGWRALRPDGSTVPELERRKRKLLKMKP